MRTIAILALLLAAKTLSAQELEFDFDVPFNAHQIEQAAIKSFSDLEAKVSKLEAENESLRLQIRELTKGKEPIPAVADDKPHLTIITATNCPHCPEAKRLVKAWAEKVGYAFENVEHREMKRGKTYPHFRLCWGENCEEFDSSVTGLGDAIAARAKKWGAKVDFKPLQFVPRQSVPVPVKSSQYRAPNKVWGRNEGHVTQSVEGMTIEYHLTQHHGVDITGMTVDEMEAKHREKHRGHR